MATSTAVKTRLLLLGIGCWSALAAAEQPPDARQILQSVRIAQASQHKVLHGQLRMGGQVSPFRLVIDGPLIRYEFSQPRQIIQLRLLARDSRLEEIVSGEVERVAAARFDDKVRGSDISYEDLAMKFLYWPNAVVEGSQTMLLRRCWKIRTEPPAKANSQYGRVMLWIDQESGALMQAEAFDEKGKFARRFKVISGQKIGGNWMLKSMRIEAPAGGRGGDRTPTYLEIEGVEKSG